MDNGRPSLPLTASNIAKLQKICISSSTDDDDSDKTKSYYSDSEHESLSSANFPIQYKLPQRKQSMVNPSVNRTPMNRMAATNISVRMKHGTTARDIIVPLNRNTATPSSSGTTRRNTSTQSISSATRRNTTTPLTRGKAQRDTTTPLNNSKPTQNALPASSFYVPAQWMFPSASSSRTVSSSNKSNTPMLPPKSRAPAPPYTAPPPYVEPSKKPQTSKYAKRSQCPIPPYRYPSSSPPYTSQSSSMTYTSRSSSLTNTSQSFTMRNMSQMLTSSVRSQSSAPSYRPKYPTPSSSKSFYTSQSSSQTSVSQNFKTPNTSQISKTPGTSKTSMHSKRSQPSTPSYRPRCPTPTSGPPYTSQSSSLTNTSPTSTYSLKSQSPTPPSRSLRNSTLTDSIPTPVPLQTSQSSEKTNTSQTSTYSLKSQSLAPSRSLRNSTLTDSIPTPVPLQTSQSSEKTNTSQTSTYFLRSQSSTSSRSFRNSTLPGSSKSFAPIDASKRSSSSKSRTSQSSAPIDKLLKSSSVRLTPRSAHYSASPSFSHYTFPRAAHYKTPVSGTYCRVMPQSSTKNSYPLSVFEPTRDVWPTEIGSEVRVSMQNVWYVLVSEMQTLSKETILQSSGRKSQNYPSVDFLPLFLEKIENPDALQDQIKNELMTAWEYFNHLEVDYIQPNGIVKGICKNIKYEDVLKLPLDEKFMLVNMARQYKANNLLFETKYDYSKIPENTIVDESNKQQIMQWLRVKKWQKYYWFFKTLNYFEIQNLTPTNIQKFVIRANCNKTISLIDQMNICCKIKAIRERPISLIAILIFLRSDDNENKRKVVNNYLIPFIEDMLQFPASKDNIFLEDIMNQYIAEIWQLLSTYILGSGLPKEDIEMLMKLNLQNTIMRNKS